MDSTSEKSSVSSVVPKSAASVVLLREGSDGVEIYLLRRHRKAGFMASSYVFPGGICDEGESDTRETAVRELFEESGVLLSSQSFAPEQRQSMRDALNADGTMPPEGTFDVSGLHYFAHWITPTVEKRRYSAEFYLAVMPEGQIASPDNTEVVDEIWVTPAQALAQAKELRLPPPQVRTCLELLELAKGGIAAILEGSQSRSDNRHAILPRLLASEKDVTLLLPWDVDYDRGQGEALAMPSGHALAWGPSRFVLSDGEWHHTLAPGADEE
ncbi:MAG: NUDIX hydrolase [Kofleriaceae bacterium]|nr:NUDIX hydrolase [Kofleriaceae bacterium]